jgi:UDP-N-acetylglucosamine 1-carboxyvinyltransferase
MGSCLSRFGEATIAYPGGCAIGERPIDFHIQAFRAMGAVVEEQEDAIVCRCPHGLHGTDIVLPFPSVGATENIILAAVRADGTTTIQNAAREPEIVELCRFLKKAGAKIRGEGSTHISIEGQHTLRGVFWRLCDDRIVFLTFAMLVAGCGGELFLPTKELFGEKEREVFCRLGGRIRVTKEGVVLQRKEAIHPIPYLCTGPYPAFSTDGQSLLLPVLARANGVSTIEERIFENRFQIIGQLRKMGANIDYVSNRAQICGVTRLHGADVTASDLRSGAGLLIAAAMADGSSRIEGTEKIERGYEDIVNIMCRAGVRARSV